MVNKEKRIIDFDITETIPLLSATRSILKSTQSLAQSGADNVEKEKNTKYKVKTDYYRSDGSHEWSKSHTEYGSHTGGVAFFSLVFMLAPAIISYFVLSYFTTNFWSDNYFLLLPFYITGTLINLSKETDFITSRSELNSNRSDVIFFISMAFGCVFALYLIFESLVLGWNIAFNETYGFGGFEGILKFGLLLALMYCTYKLLLVGLLYPLTISFAFTMAYFFTKSKKHIVNMVFDPILILIVVLFIVSLEYAGINYSYISLNFPDVNISRDHIYASILNLGSAALVYQWVRFSIRYFVEGEYKIALYKSVIVKILLLSIYNGIVFSLLTEHDFELLSEALDDMYVVNVVLFYGLLSLGLWVSYESYFINKDKGVVNRIGKPVLCLLLYLTLTLYYFDAGSYLNILGHVDDKVTEVLRSVDHINPVSIILDTVSQTLAYYIFF